MTDREHGDRSVTVLATRLVLPGREFEFEAFLRRLGDGLAGFPGCLGTATFAPVPPSREYVLMYRYDSHSSMQAWRASAERRSLIEESAELTEAPPTERRLSGTETWFATPGGAVVRPPARWKMWLLSAGGIYPVITVLTMLAGPLLAALPMPVRSAIIVPLLSAAMTWLVMPALSRLFARQLYD